MKWNRGTVFRFFALSSDFLFFVKAHQAKRFNDASHWRPQTSFNMVFFCAPGGYNSRVSVP